MGKTKTTTRTTEITIEREEIEIIENIVTRKVITCSEDKFGINQDAGGSDENADPCPGKPSPASGSSDVTIF